jgi:hypothetical protein
VTGDGVPDLLTGNSDAHTVGVLTGLGGGRYSNPQPILVGDRTDVVRTADLNGDGRADVVTLGPTGVRVLFSQGGGHFAAPVVYDVGAGATGLTVADVNHDGHPDILVGNTFGDVLTLLNNGDGTFQPYRPAATGVALAVADLNGDGVPDFVFADQQLDQVAIQYGNAHTQVLQDRSKGILAPGAVQLADLNGDGIKDLVVANSGGNDVLVYPGLGNGQFGPPQAFATGTDPVGLTVADLNGDGIPDLAVADQGSNDVTILLGQGKGSDWTFKSGPRLDSHGLGPVSTTVQFVPNPQGGAPSRTCWWPTASRTTSP